MSRKIVLLELMEDNVRRVNQLLEEVEDNCLYWMPDGQGNSIAITIWHTARVFDVFMTQHIRAKPAGDEIWFSGRWAERTGYDPRGSGTHGWRAVIGYSSDEVKAIPQMPRALLKGYFDEVTACITEYARETSEAVLSQPSLGFEGKQPNYFWVRHPLFDLTRHVGEMLAIRAMWERRG